MEIVCIKQGHPLWEKTINYAQECSWKAGPYLASRMQNNAFNEWESVIVATAGDSIIGYCTLSEKDELPDEYCFTPFIGFMFVDENARGKQISEKMIEMDQLFEKEL
ncbi:GNAT family N-acetyltransferase [Butyrivibrio sp. VCB2006]|uniref:GNAT family N-acetyltransferase n=1 Tax=Butyrivibrio sp. VCB2006 TaxID=1280679 RepID=UPI0004924B50|nr:GNAT family N-acetyltransferase [Butyrivibrio sp. VCB2006]